jgi:hypothetical protein
VLKLRRVYNTTAGTHLGEQVSINGYLALGAHVPSKLASTPRTDAILVHPTPAKVTLAGGFEHSELRTVTEPYTVQVPYMTTESYSCGSGTSFRMCTRMVTQYRSETRYRTVLKDVSVSDGSCSRAVLFAPAENGVYLVDFTYSEAGVCTASCLEQVGMTDDGAFRTRPCPQPTPEQVQALSE